MHLLIPVPFSIVACYTDIRARKIKNYITYPLIFLGVFINTFLNGFQGFKESILGILIMTIVLSIIPVAKLGGGDLKLAMGYGTFLGKEKYIMFYFLFLLFTLLGSMFFLIKKEGLKSFFSDLKLEIKTFGRHKTKFKEIPGAPFMLGAYLVVTVFFSGLFTV